MDQVEMETAFDQAKEDRIEMDIVKESVKNIKRFDN